MARFFLGRRSFPDHVAGTPYVLTREQFIDFAGLRADYERFLAVITEQNSSGILPDGPHSYQPAAQALWAAIASKEAMRRFNPLAEQCISSLEIDITHHGAMKWCYETTSGTVFTAIEHREYKTRPASGYPGLECADELHEASFKVQIPANRDCPGRTHYEAIRDGSSYMGS